MAFNIDASYSPSLAKITGDTNAAAGAPLLDSVTGTAITVAVTEILTVIRIFGRITGDWTLKYRLDGVNTTIGAANAGSDNLDIPGIEIAAPAGATLIITGTDAAPELYAQYFKRKLTGI